MPEKADVVISMGIDIKDVKKNAEEAAQAIKNILEKDSGTENPRIYKILQGLKKVQADIERTSKSFEKLQVDPKTGNTTAELAQKVLQARDAAKAASKAYHDYREELSQTVKGQQVLAKIAAKGTDSKYAYFGANADKKAMVDKLWKLSEALTDARNNVKTLDDALKALEGRQSQAEMGFAANFKKSNEEAKVLLLSYNELIKKDQELENKSSKTDSFRSKFYFARTIINDINRNLNKLSDKFKQFGKHVADAAKKMMHLGKESDKATSTLKDGFKHALKNIMRYGLGVRSLYFLFRRLRGYAKETLQEMAKAFPEVNAQMSRAVTALNQMKASIGTAVQPLLTVLVPALEKVAALIVKIANLIGSLFAMFTGQKTIYSAVAVQTDYAASLDKTGASAKKAKKELEGYLSPIDEINKFTSNKDNDSGGGAGGGGLQYEEVPIPDYAKTLKDIIDKLINPIKKAWAKVGDFVVTAWKKAFKSVKELLIDIGKDFLEVWNEDATVAMLEDILRIFGGIGALIDIIAVKLDIAWNTNENGKKILEAIRDIFAIIVGHIKNAVQYTENWAMQLNFVPLVEKFREWLESMEPVVDAISGVFEDFYEKVLLPLGKWAIEEGLPDLLQIFIDFNNKVDWEAIRANLADFWEHLEPFAERVGEGLIDFIGDLSDKLAEFINSGKFEDLLDHIEEWMDNVSAEDVSSTLGKLAELLPKLAVGFIALKGAFSGMSALLPIVGGIAKLSEALSGAGGGAAAGAGGAGLAESAAAADAEMEALAANLAGLTTDASATEGSIGGASTAIGGISASTGAAAAAIAVLVAAFATLWSTSEEFRNDMKSIWEDIKKAFSDFASRMSPKLKEFWDTMKSGFKQLVDFIKPVWMGFCKFLGPEFKAAWELIKIIFNSALKVLEGAFDIFAGIFTGNWKQVWEGIKEIFVGVFQSILDTAGVFFNRLTEHINNLSSKLNGKTILGYTINIPTITPWTPPKLAQGAVIPPNREFMAVLGDQRQGTNIETPLDTMIEAFNAALSQNGGSGRTEINFLLPDRRKIAQYVLEGGRIMQTSTGKNPFELA